MDDKEDGNKSSKNAPLPGRKYSSPIISIRPTIEASSTSIPGPRGVERSEEDSLGNRVYSTTRLPKSSIIGATEPIREPRGSSSSDSSNKTSGSSKTKWRFSIFSKSKRSSSSFPPTETSPAPPEPEFLPVCPALESATAVNNEDDPRCLSARRDFQHFFGRKERDATQSANNEGKEEYGWQSPSSWGFVSRDTYAINAKPRKPSLDQNSNRQVSSSDLWALRIFKPLDTSDGVTSRAMASSGYSYVTVSCELESTAAEICQLLMKKFTSNRDLTRFRLYVIHRNTERLLEHEDQPVKVLQDYLLTLGYTEEDQMSKIAREDHSYCCRFIYREYPPAPPKSEDFLEQTTLKKGSRPPGPTAPSPSFGTIGKARITTRSAYLADANLSVMPTIMFQDAATMEFIDLSRNTLLSLPDDLFEMLTNLRLLRLVENLLDELPPAILSCPSITHLDVSCNKLTGESLAVLGNMSQLTHLNVSCNQISQLPEELRNLKGLRSLDVSSNYLKELSTCLWSMENLREINASFNKIVKIPDEIVCCKRLRSLILVGNAIQYVSPHLTELTGLQQLDVRGNLLSSIDNIQSINSLLEAAVDYNQLTSINNPSWPHVTSISGVNNALTGIVLKDYLYQLKNLDLAGNKLVNLPEDIFAFMSNLETLCLQENELSRLPKSINSLAKLEKLVAYENDISEIALEFQFLPRLQVLEMHTNNIRIIGAEIWNAQSLRVLNLSSNFLQSFPNPPISMGPLPLTRSLEELLIADNRLSEDFADALVLLKELKVLNISYNRIFSLGDTLRELEKLIELYVSGNGLNAFPEDIERCSSLRMLFVNFNKLANLPGDLGKNSNLAVFDAQSNILKYNITNWPYDWNWNFNAELQYLNLANNKRLEIRGSIISSVGHPLHQQVKLTDFKSMHKLRLLDVSNVPVASNSLPEGVASLLIRQSEQQAGLTVAVADYCGRDIIFDISEFVSRSFMGQEKDHLVGLFDGRGQDFVSTYLVDTLEENLKLELRRMRQGESFSMAIRRAFLASNRDLSMQPVDTRKGSTACLLYLLENQLLVSNVGDTMAVLSREGNAIVLTTKHHPWARAEQARIRQLGGFISLQGLVEQELDLTRAFGYHHLLPFVNANPSINEVILDQKDEFVLMATSSFWNVMSYQMAVDVARKERADPEIAVQKLRDLAIARGVTNSMKIVMVDFRGITTVALDERTFEERKRTAFRREAITDQVLSRLEDEIPPPKPPCAFVFTDIKDSTKLWSLLPNAMRVAIKQHNNIMRRLMRIHGGYEVKTEGDAFVVAFQSPIQALKFCLGVQVQFLENDWPREIVESPVCAPVSSVNGALLYRGLSIRMGIHYGMADDEEDKVARRMDYHGIHMIIAARVSALADGGQINITSVIQEMWQDTADEDRPEMTIFDLGMMQLKGLPNPEHVFACYPVSLAGRHIMRRSSDRSDQTISQLRNFSISETNGSDSGRD